MLSPAVRCLISDHVWGRKHLLLFSLTLVHCAGGAGVLLHPVVSSGTDRLPHLPDLSQPDHQWGRKCILLHVHVHFVHSGCTRLQTNAAFMSTVCFMASESCCEAQCSTLHLVCFRFPTICKQINHDSWPHRLMGLTLSLVSFLWHYNESN